MLSGSAVLEDPTGGPLKCLVSGDILSLPHGGAHILHDGGSLPAEPAHNRAGLNVTFSENAGTGDRLDMLCGRFIFSTPHDRLLRDYLPPRSNVHTASESTSTAQIGSGIQLAGLVSLMQTETSVEHLGWPCHTAMFALTLRLASEAEEAPIGLLALAGNPRLTPALTAMFHEPARPWTLPELARLCNMSQATVAGHFQEKLGRSATDLLTDIRMILATNESKKASISTGAVAETVGYQSGAAFQRAFKQHNDAGAVATRIVFGR